MTVTNNTCVLPKITGYTWDRVTSSTNRQYENFLIYKWHSCAYEPHDATCLPRTRLLSSQTLPALQPCAYVITSQMLKETSALVPEAGKGNGSQTRNHLVCRVCWKCHQWAGDCSIWPRRVMYLNQQSRAAAVKLCCAPVQGPGGNTHLDHLDGLMGETNATLP